VEINGITVHQGSFSDEIFKTIKSPIECDELRIISIPEKESIKFYDYKETKYNKTNIVIHDTKGFKFESNWFEQNNLGAKGNVLFIQ
jgi:hypothetical protein